MRVLITGGAGFIGSHLAEAWLERGAEVVIVDDLSTGRADNVPGRAQFVVADITNRALWSDVPSADLVYHCAASYHDPTAWEHDARTNVLGTIEVVRYAQRCGARLVYFQTSLCYGLAPQVPVRIDAPLAPTGSYAVSKTAAEAYIRDSGVPYVSLRLANMYGPRNLSGPVPAFYRRLSAGQPCTVVDSRRDFVFVGDLVEVAVKAATRGSGPYHVASGGDRAVGDIYAAVAAHFPDAPEPTLVARQPDDAPTIRLDPSVTEATFGWHVSTPLDEGVAAAVEWYRSHEVTRTFTHLKLEASR